MAPARDEGGKDVRFSADESILQTSSMTNFIFRAWKQLRLKGPDYLLKGICGEILIWHLNWQMKTTFPISPVASHRSLQRQRVSFPLTFSPFCVKSERLRLWLFNIRIIRYDKTYEFNPWPWIWVSCTFGEQEAAQWLQLWIRCHVWYL